MLPCYILHTLNTSEDLKILKLLHSIAVNVSRLFQSSPESKRAGQRCITLDAILTEWIT